MQLFEGVVGALLLKEDCCLINLHNLPLAHGISSSTLGCETNIAQQHCYILPYFSMYKTIFLSKIFRLKIEGRLIHWFLTLGYSGVLDCNSQKPSPPAVLTGVSGSCSSKASE